MQIFGFIERKNMQSISNETNNDYLNLNSMTKLSGWLRYFEWSAMSVEWSAMSIVQ